MIESAGEGEREREPDRDQAALLPPEGEEAAQGRPKGKIGWIDVVHAVLRPCRGQQGCRVRALSGDAGQERDDTSAAAVNGLTVRRTRLMPP